VAGSVKLVIRVINLTRFNMFFHKSIINLNILKKPKRTKKRPAAWAYICERKNQSASAFKLKPTRLSLLFLFSFKGVDGVSSAILEFGHHCGGRKMKSMNFLPMNQFQPLFT